MATVGAHDAGRVVLQDADGCRWLSFEAPVAVLRTRRAERVLPILEQAEEATRRGLWAAGFLTYEAAAAIEPAYRTRPPGSLPLVWFGLYDRPREIDPEGDQRLPFRLGPWTPTVSAGVHREAVAAIRAWIARGDTYQINYTFRLRSRFAGDPWSLCRELWRNQAGRCGAFIDLGEHVLCSASPELFFSVDGSRIVARPMKGTAPRGLAAEDDLARAARLGRSEKNRAENLMIVDMVRNDLGRVAIPGSVRVPRLFDVERYEPQFQMTSTIEARSDAPLSRILAALFPSASITGAPKVRTMQLISELEAEPRGIYTGAIGCLAPGRRARFNVAIRTVHVDRGRGCAEFGTGGGIVWDSIADEEYRECQTKALVLTRARPRFSLLETLVWRPGEGLVLLERHLERLVASARYFAIPVDPDAVRSALVEHARRFRRRPHRIRLTVDARGRPELESTPLETAGRPWRVALARRPIDADDRFLYHKTTRRHVYRAARAARPGYDDVLLWNRRGEVTESTVANLVVRLGSQLLTPPVDCGLLPGTLRAELLARRELGERRLRAADLAGANAVFLINSVRGWIPVELDLSTPGPRPRAETRAARRA